MKRRLFNLAAAVLLLLAITIGVLWVRSYQRNEGITCYWRTQTEQSSWAVQSCYCVLDLRIEHHAVNGSPVAPSYEYRNWTQFDPGRKGPWFPFRPVRLSEAPPPRDYMRLTIAYWLLFPPTLILPTIAFARHRRRRRREAGNLCPTCGYDLRAHNAGDRCPECGRVSATSAAHAATQRVGCASSCAKSV